MKPISQPLSEELLPESQFRLCVPVPDRAHDSGSYFGGEDVHTPSLWDPPGAGYNLPSLEATPLNLPSFRMRQKATLEPGSHPGRNGVRRARARTYRIIDLFSGCGGLTLGFAWDSLFGRTEPNPLLRRRSPLPSSPFRVALANDFDAAALATYRLNFDPSHAHSRPGSIESILAGGAVIPKADVVIGGPPCQGFSLLNKQRHQDVRRELWWHFMEVADRADAKVIVMENVPQLLGTMEFRRMLERLRDLGYSHLMAHVLCAANYGVPQVRNRAIVLASRCGPIALPIPTHLSADRLHRLNGSRSAFGACPSAWTNVEAAIGDLEDPEGTEIRRRASATNRLHFGRQPTAVSLQRYRAVPYGGNRFDLQRNAPGITPGCWIRKTSGGTDLFGRLWWERPSVTIRTEFFKPEKGRYLHPVQHRPITHREAARIQSFPDRFDFAGSKIEIAKQIGNAVPPLLAFAIAKRVHEALQGRTTLEEMERTRIAFRSLLGEPVTGVWLGKKIPAG